MDNSIFSVLEGLWTWTWLMDHRNGVALCKRGNWRLLDKNFESKSIKEEGKNPDQQFQIILTSESLMAQQFTIASNSLNSYSTPTLNNVNLVKMMNSE